MKYSYYFLIVVIVLTGLVIIPKESTNKKSLSPQEEPIRASYKSTDVQGSGKQGDTYRLFINNINLPMNSRGVLADVDIPPEGSNGLFKGKNFLFSSGFHLSGYGDGQLWANAVASADLVKDYITGRAIPGPNDDSQMYVLNVQDPDFGPSWQDWIDAVALGADFYDGDGNGIYNPADKNGNGVWDPDEDRPDLIGDETVWCVYNDGVPSSQRRWDTVPQYGIEIRQTAFAFAAAGSIGNIIFLRYRIKYTGLGNPGEADKLTDVYFGAWADADIGDYELDVVGSDVSRDVGYTYDNQNDYVWGDQPPCFMMDFFSGPRAYVAGETFIDNNGNGEYDDGIDTPLDTAYSVRGQVMGVEEFPGAKNMRISSFVLIINSNQYLGSPSRKEEARNYSLGLDRLGFQLDPCTFPYGEVRGGVDCNTVDPRFWFSGDPVTNVGWICSINEDVRQLTNTGPFELIKGEENEIVVGYVVGQGAYPLESINAARYVDDRGQELFDSNFDPNFVPVELTTFTAVSQAGKVKLSWSTSTETNNLGFEIERASSSTDQVFNKWIRIGFVKGNGTTTEPQEYKFVDDVSTINVKSLGYRLKQIDFDGSYEYSDEVLVNNIAPSTYKLSQNYPNPFNPSTIIKFSIPEEEWVKINVYDVLGKKVVELLNSKMIAGQHEIEFDGSNLAGGVYLYTLEIKDRYKNTKKMLLLK